MTIVVAATGVPAYAAVQYHGGFLAGSVAQGTLSAWAELKWEYVIDHREITLSQGVEIGPNFNTSATGCKATIWLDLMDSDLNQWKTGTSAENCISALFDRGSRWRTVHYTSRTKADFWKGHICVYLYFNFSPTSGWHRCYDRPNWQQADVF